MSYPVPCLIFLQLSVIPASAKTICTVIPDPGSGMILLEQGYCRSQVIPPSIFKVALSLIGFDTGFLTGANVPLLPFKQGYPDRLTVPLS